MLTETIVDARTGVQLAGVECAGDGLSVHFRFPPDPGRRDKARAATVGVIREQIEGAARVLPEVGKFRRLAPQVADARRRVAEAERALTRLAARSLSLEADPTDTVVADLRQIADERAAAEKLRAEAEADAAKLESMAAGLWVDAARGISLCTADPRLRMLARLEARVAEVRAGFCERVAGFLAPLVEAEAEYDVFVAEAFADVTAVPMVRDRLIGGPPAGCVRTPDGRFQVAPPTPPPPSPRPATTVSEIRLTATVPR